jgi:hypothetical protein
MLIRRRSPYGGGDGGGGLPFLHDYFHQPRSLPWHKRSFCGAPCPFIELLVCSIDHAGTSEGALQ